MVQNETLEQLLSEQEQLENVEKKEKNVRTSAADFSEETATMDDFAEELEASYKRVRSGDVMKGTVISVDEEGVVLDLDYFTPGRVEPDEISDDPNFHYLTDLKNGDTVSATVMSTDDGSGYLLMSIREANRDEAWAKLEKLMRDKRPVRGKITEVVPAGAIMFVEGIRGFIPVSRLATSHVDDTAEYLNQMMEVLVIEADEQEHKLILSARELLAQKEIEEKNKKVNRIKVDSVVEGTVEQIKDYGAFVNIGDGLSGLLHISQISEQRIKNPRAVLKEGQSVRVKIIKVENGKISLSMKALADLAAKEEEEVAFEYKEEGEATTGLGSLLAKLKL